MNTIKFDNVEYKVTDLNTEFTLRQQKVARKFLLESIIDLQENEQVKKLQTETESLNKDADNYNNELNKLNAKYSIVILDQIANLDYDAKVLALLLIPKDEKFNVESYEKRVELFEDLPITKELEGLINDFFTSKLQSILKSSLTSLKAIKAIKGIA